MKKLTAILLLFALFPYCSFAEPVSSAISSVSRIQEIARELSEISTERESYLQELENTNNERRIELQERMSELALREKELRELKLQLELFGGLIDDQALYYRSLNRKLTFWRTTSWVLLTGLITALIYGAVSK